MNNSPNKNNNNKNDKIKRRIFTLLPYILIPLIMVGAITVAGRTAKEKSEKIEYYQIVQYFDEGKIDKFSLNLSSGTLKYTLVGENEKEKEYRVPNVNIFVNLARTLFNFSNCKFSKIVICFTR